MCTYLLMLKIVEDKQEIIKTWLHRVDKRKSMENEPYLFFKDLHISLFGSQSYSERN